MDRGQGSNSTSIRSHNEKTVLHLLRYKKKASRNDMAQHTDLTSQSLATITGSLEKKKLIVNAGKEIRGIGQPSFIYELNPDGAFSIGCNIGRRSLDIVLINFIGDIIDRKFFEYQYPDQDFVVDEIKQFIDDSFQKFPLLKENSFAGVGIGMPYFLGSWKEEFSGNNQFKKWDQELFQTQLLTKCNGVIYIENDMNAASMGALLKGSGNQMESFIYLYLGTFIGGGVVMDRKLAKGNSGNAGNFGTMMISIPEDSPIYDPQIPNPCQLLKYVSIYALGKYLEKNNVEVPDNTKDFFTLLDSPSINKYLTVWIDEISKLLGQTILQINSVLDLDDVIFDGSLPNSIKKQIGKQIKKSFNSLDVTGLRVPNITFGSLGVNARALGSAMIPIYEQYVPNSYAIG